jgi:hypothetical protein
MLAYPTIVVRKESATEIMFQVLLPAEFDQEHRRIVLDFVQRGHEFGRAEWQKAITAFDLLKNAAVLTGHGLLPFPVIYRQYVEELYADEFIGALYQASTFPKPALAGGQTLHALLSRAWRRPNYLDLMCPLPASSWPIVCTGGEPSRLGTPWRSSFSVIWRHPVSSFEPTTCAELRNGCLPTIWKSWVSRVISRPRCTFSRPHAREPYCTISTSLGFAGNNERDH